jgi:hypothetical protein
MVDKFVVYFGDATFAMKYHFLRQELHVGGHKLFRQQMECLLVEYFYSRLPRVKIVDHSRIRYKVSGVTADRYRTGIAFLREQGATLDVKTNLERLMR